MPRMISTFSKFTLCALATLMLAACYTITNNTSTTVITNGHSTKLDYSFAETHGQEVQGLDGKWYDTESEMGKSILYVYAVSGTDVAKIPLRDSVKNGVPKTVKFTFDDGVTKTLEVPSEITSVDDPAFSTWIDRILAKHYYKRSTYSYSSSYSPPSSPAASNTDTSCESKTGSAACKAVTDAVTSTVQEQILNTSQSLATGKASCVSVCF